MGETPTLPEGFRLLHHCLRDGAEIPDEAEFFQNTKDVVGGVDLVGEEALACGVRKAVVIIVPAFAEGDQGEKEVIARVVTGVEAAFSPDMCEGIDEQGAMEQDGSGDKERPDEELPHRGAERWCKGFQRRADGEHDDTEGDRDDLIVAVEPDEFGKFHKIRNGLVIRGKIPL